MDNAGESGGVEKEIPERKIDTISLGLLGFLAGVFLSSVVSWEYVFVIPLLLAISAAFFGKIAFPKNAALLSIIFFSIALGSFRLTLTENNLAEKEFRLTFNSKVTLTGFVTAPSEAGTYGSQFVIEEKNGDKKIRFLVRESKGNSYFYGDTVTLTGTLKKPESFLTPQGSIFDYPGYLKKDGILGIISASSIEKESTGGGNGVKRILFRFEQNLETSVQSLMPGSTGNLANGVFLGDKAITKERRDEFITTGTVHIIALSGYNVSVVAKFFTDIFSFLPLVWSLSIGGLSIFLFVLMTGLQSSAVRAGIMASIVLFAKSKGRSVATGRLILLAAVLMVLYNPLFLYYDVSFQLSFLATVGIIYITPRVSHWFKKIPVKAAGMPLREIISTTIATQLFVLPFILYKTGVLSLIGPIANALVLPLVPYLMGFTAVIALLGLIFLPIAMPFALIGKGLAGYILFIIHAASKIPLAATTIHIGVFAMLILYSFLLYWLDPFGWRKSSQYSSDLPQTN